MDLHVLYRLADLVARVREPVRIYAAAVDAVMSAAQADRASILVLDAAGVMRFEAWRGLSDRYRAAVEGHSPWGPDTRNPSVIAVPDVRGAPDLGGLRSAILSEGILSLAFIPLVHQGRLLGKFMVYYDQPHRLSGEELQVAELVSHHVAFALDRARAEAAISDLLERERSARVEAEAASHAKDSFLAMLAHELRNPLSAIVNAVSILDRAADPEPVAGQARRLIRRQTTQLARLLDDLLDVARISRGHIELRSAVLDLRTVVGLAVEAQRHQIEGKGQHLDLSLADEPAIVRGDAARLQQVVGNILDNASKYTPPGGSIRLTLAIESGEAILRLRDSGPGIPPDRLASIFEPFMQVDPTAARTQGGLGIGLTLVRRIVDLHGGTIQAHSEGPGAGAEFTLRLPLAAHSPVLDPALDGQGLTPRRLVLIEDNEDARDALAGALQLQGHDVRTAGTGREGVEMVLRERPDLVLVDIGLPDADGYEIGRLLRDKLGSEVRLVALTGYGQPEDRRRSAQAGFDAHLVKPVAGEDVLRILAELDSAAA